MGVKVDRMTLRTLVCLSRELPPVTDLVSAGPLIYFLDVLKVTGSLKKGSFPCSVPFLGNARTRTLNWGLQRRSQLTGTSKLGKGPRLPSSEVSETSCKPSRAGRGRDSGRQGPVWCSWL